MRMHEARSFCIPVLVRLQPALDNCDILAQRRAEVAIFAAERTLAVVVFQHEPALITVCQQPLDRLEWWRADSD